MMTDLQKFQELYASLGIQVQVVDGLGGSYFELREEGPNAKLNGYCGHFTRIEFDSNGKFLSQGFWED